MSKGLPVQGWGSLISTIDQLRTDGINKSPEVKEYSHTWDNYSITIVDSPQKIVNILEPGSYQILIKNLDRKPVFLYLGKDGLEHLTLQNSAFQLSPQGKKLTTKECTIWGISFTEARIVVTIHSTQPNANKSPEEMPIPLTIKTDAPTGQNFYLPDNFYDSNGEYYLREKGDSQLGIDGFKLFSFSSYDQTISAQDGYEFNLTIDSQFNTIDYGENEFIQIHEITRFTEKKLKLWFSGGWADNILGYLPKNPLSGLRTWVSGGRIIDGQMLFKNICAKEDESSKLKLTDKIILKPSLLTECYLLKVKLDTGEYRNAVFDFDQVNQTFNILGF